MYYSHLLMLEQKYDEELITNFDNYLSQCTVAQLQNITVETISISLDLDPVIATRLLRSCVDIGFMNEQFVICCPECGFKLKRINSLSELPDDKILCYSCEEERPIMPENIEVIYSLSNLDFESGQHALTASTVVPMNSLKRIIEAEGINALLFHPTDSEYEELKKLCKDVRGRHPTTTSAGNALENLVKRIIRCCSILDAVSARTTTNQLDVLVRNKSFVPYGVLSEMGQHFIVECKNENSTPSGSYFSKMHSILEIINNGHKNVCFGMIVSKQPAPATFQTLANKYYLKDGITIISISLNEIESIMEKKQNFLDMVERKILEIHFDATSDLVANGLFSC